jgi:exosortase E/protease (VPEID-CTERM system)
VISFLLNSVRIAALFLLGSAGFERIAAGGFHSQAGWISFNVVALGVSVVARDFPWISTRSLTLPGPSAAVVSSNATLPWLLPFLIILAAGMVSRALSAGFEWLYGLRFVLAAGALWWFRETYKRLNWRCDWTGPAAGVLVFFLWILLDSSSSSGMPAELAAATPAGAFLWIALRSLGAVLTVPVAEELAFRGFLFRRMISADFESVPWTRFSWAAFMGSSVLFGLLHGSRWISGVLAGGIYALAVLRRGRFSNAVVAHATTNALIAADVLLFHHWSLW